MSDILIGVVQASAQLSASNRNAHSRKLASGTP